MSPFPTFTISLFFWDSAKPGMDLTCSKTAFKSSTMIALLWLLMRFVSLLITYQYRRPRNLHLVGFPTPFGGLLTGLYGVISSPKIILEGYKKARGSPFAVPSLRNYHVYISSEKHIKELNNAPGTQLSFFAVIAEMIYPKYTMHGFTYKKEDPYGIWSTSTIKSGFHKSLPRMQVALQQIIKDTFNSELKKRNNINGWIEISPSSMSHQIAISVNAYAILGEDFSKDPANRRDASLYTRDAVITGEILQRIPSFLHPIVGKLLMKWSGAEERLCQCIDTIIRRRISEGHGKSREDGKPLALIEHLIDNPRRDENATVLDITQRALGFVFGAAFQMPMFTTFAIYRLCKHPEYVDSLRQEISSMSQEELYSNTKLDTPLLDSFLKETARHHPLDNGSADRKVLSDFTFSDGTYVPAGNYIKIAEHALMLDSKNYDDATKFDGFRFVTTTEDIASSLSRFIQPSTIFPFWGSVGRTCPGRFYVSNIAKMTMVYLLLNFDLQLVNADSNPSLSLGTNILPSPWLKVLIRPRF